MVKLAENFFERAKFILNNEGVEYDEKVIPPIIIKHAPDWRRILNELQRHSVLGFVGVSDSVSTGYDDLFQYLKEKDFKKMRSWVVNNIDTDAAAIFRAIYDRMYDKVDPQSIPQLVLILADYQYKNAFVADHELNVVACLTEVMANVKFA
jgi:DNA polymerase III delta prime subunit